MHDWTEIRRKVLVENVSKRQVCREYGIAFETLQKILANPQPPGYRQSVQRKKIKLGSLITEIEKILAEDTEAPPKQHHTAKRIFERLRDEHAYLGGITQVQEEVARYRRHHQEVFMPLSQPPGEAQFDFGEAWVCIAGKLCKAHFGVMSLPYSDAFHLSAYPRENTETFQAAHVAAFDFFGGVPTKTAYDNTKIAVAKIIGSERELTRGFLELESFFLFTHRFCRVRRGNEKGHVEGTVGYARRNFMVPIPEADSFEHLNQMLEARCREDLGRTLWGNTQAKAELLKVDQAAMLQVPEATFEARRIVQARSNSLSLVRFDKNAYSVPTAFAHHELTVAGGVDEVTISCADEFVTTHPRCWDRQQVIYNPRHYLALLEKKPGALDAARPLEGWELPECFALLRRRLEADLGHGGTREFIKVLRLAEHTTLRQLAGAVGYGLSIGATTPEAIGLILRHRRERPVSLFALDGYPHLKSYSIEPPDLSAYSALEGAER